MTIDKIISLARKHAGENESAILCLRNANLLAGAGQYEQASKRALRSLMHSVGIFHSDYRAAKGE